MFNTTIVNRTEYVPTTVNVTEKRAPTDASVALLKEMESAAKNKLIASIHVECNSIKGEWLVFDDHLTDRLSSIILVDINGNKVRAEDSIGRHELINRDAAEKYISERLAGIVTRQIMSDCANSQPKLRETINKLF